MTTIQVLLILRKENLFGVDSFTETQVCIPNGFWLNKEDLKKIVEVINNFI
jgi:hypothetical protein